MQFGTWDTLFNILLAIFWFRIWTADDRSLYFNPYLAPLERLSNSTLNFLRPVFFGIPPKLIAAITLTFLIVFRAMAFHSMAVSSEASWVLKLGFELRRLDNAGIVSFLAFSVISFTIFLFKLWGLSLIYVRIKHISSSSRFAEHTTETLYHLSRPFSDFRTELRPLALLVSGILLAFLLNLVPETTPATPIWRETSLLTCLLKFSISSLAGWVQVLPIMRSLMIFLIIGSIASMFTASRALMFFCREWIDLFLGPLRRYPIRIGMFDLTPIVFFFIIGFIYQILMGILLRSYFSIG